MSAVCETKRVRIYKGSDKSYNIRLLDEKDEPFLDLTTLNTGDSDEITVLHAKDGGGSVDAKLSNANAPKVEVLSADKIKITLSETDTALLKEGLQQQVEIEVKSNSGADTALVQTDKVVDVRPRLFS